MCSRAFTVVPLRRCSFWQQEQCSQIVRGVLQVVVAIWSGGRHFVVSQQQQRMHKCPEQLLFDMSHLTNRSVACLSGASFFCRMKNCSHAKLFFLNIDPGVMTFRSPPSREPTHSPTCSSMCNQCVLCSTTFPGGPISQCLHTTLRYRPPQTQPSRYTSFRCNFHRWWNAPPKTHLCDPNGCSSFSYLKAASPWLGGGPRGCRFIFILKLLETIRL